MGTVSKPREGSEYLHYKGGLYSIVAVALNATNAADGTEVVVYKSQKDGAVYVRNMDEFLELIEWPDGVTRSRFVPADTF